MVCRRTWRQRLHSHRRRCAVFSRGSSDLSPPALRTLRRPSAAAITKADNTGCVTTGTANTSNWQVVSSAPESNFTGRFDAVVSGAMILRHTDPQLGPIQLLCPSSAPRRTTRQIYFDRPLYCIDPTNKYYTP